MLKAITGLSADVIGFTAEGVVTADDYAEHLVPAIEAVLARGGTPRLLYVLGADFKRYNLGGLLADTRVGFSHLQDFDRIAVVTDHDWIEDAIRAFGMMIPCPVKVFDDDELEEAKAWIEQRPAVPFELTVERSGALAFIHARLYGTLDRETEEKLIQAAEDGIGDAGEIRVLLQAEDFHGWRDLHAFWYHIRFVAGQRRKLERVAIVSDVAWQRRLVAAARHVLRVDARQFDDDELEEAQAWLRA